MTIEQARKICLSMHGAAEGQDHGHPDPRGGNTIFASLQPEKETAVLRLPMEMAEAVTAEAANARRLVSRFGGCGWVAFELAKTEVEDFRGLAEIALHARQTTKKG